MILQLSKVKIYLNWQP